MRAETIPVTDLQFGMDGKATRKRVIRVGSKGLFGVVNGFLVTFENRIGVGAVVKNIGLVR